MKRHLVATREFDGAQVQNLCSVRSEFEGFFLGDATQTVRLGDNTRICGEQAVDVGVDFTDVSVQGCRERDCGRI